MYNNPQTAINPYQQQLARLFLQNNPAGNNMLAFNQTAANAHFQQNLSYGKQDFYQHVNNYPYCSPESIFYIKSDPKNSKKYSPVFTGRPRKKLKKSRTQNSLKKNKVRPETAPYQPYQPRASVGTQPFPKNPLGTNINGYTRSSMNRNPRGPVNDWRNSADVPAQNRSYSNGFNGAEISKPANHMTRDYEMRDRDQVPEVRAQADWDYSATAGNHNTAGLDRNFIKSPKKSRNKNRISKNQAIPLFTDVKGRDFNSQSYSSRYGYDNGHEEESYEESVEDDQYESDEYLSEEEYYPEDENSQIYDNKSSFKQKPEILNSRKKTRSILRKRGRPSLKRDRVSINPRVMVYDVESYKIYNVDISKQTRRSARQQNTNGCNVF